jgi:hypothetical protein
VLEVPENCERVRYDGMGFFTFNVYNKPYTARIVLELGVVQTLFLRISHRLHKDTFP